MDRLCLAACAGVLALACSNAPGGSPDAGDPLDSVDAMARPPRSDASVPADDPPLVGCAAFTPPSPCGARDGLDVFCTAAGQSVGLAGRVEYDPGLPLMAMGVGTATAVDGFDLGYISGAYPFRCMPSGCENSIGTGNSNGTDGRICEITFDHTVASASTGTAVYRITADPAAEAGDYLFGFQATADEESTPATHILSPRFYLRIGPGGPE